MSNRPVKKKKVVEITQEDFDVEWTPPPRTARDRLIQGGVLFLILAFLLPAVTCAITPSESTETQLERQQQQQDEVELSIRRYSKELAEKPNDPAILANLGHYTNIKSSRIQDETERMTLLATAEKYLRDSLAQDAEYAFAQAELAKNLMLQEKNDEAAELIASGMEKAEGDLGSEDPKTAASAKARKVELLRLSSTLDVRAGRDQDAIDKLNEVVSMKPGDPMLYMARAELHQRLGDKDSALEDYTNVVNIGQQTGNQRMVMMGQMMIEQINNPTPAATPGAEATPSAAATTAPAPEATTAPEAAATPEATPAATPNG
jgi:tetratricopeptide (TPR) repeat protein